jgi:hypothetical protein
MNTINFTINIDNITYMSYYNNITSSIEATIILCDTSIETVTIPISIQYENIDYNVTKIEACAFQNCNNLTNITINGIINSIGMYAFQNCFNLTNFTINSDSDNVILEDFVFQNCCNLTNFTINNNKNLTTINNLNTNNLCFQNAIKLQISN